MHELTAQNQINWKQLKSNLCVFAEKLESALTELRILEICKQFKIDHACLRLKNSDDVARLKSELASVGRIISSVQVNGREISIFQLDKPVQISEWRVSAIELPYPKSNHSYEDGWEHVEFVLDGVTNTMESLREKFFATFSILTKDQLEKFNYDESEPEAEGDQLPNPTIGIKVNGIGLKFHANSIQRVVGYGGVF